MLSDKSSSKNILNVGLNLDNVAVGFTQKREDLKVKDSKGRPTVIPNLCPIKYKTHQVLRSRELYLNENKDKKTGHVTPLLYSLMSNICQTLEGSWCQKTM